MKFEKLMNKKSKMIVSKSEKSEQEIIADEHAIIILLAFLKKEKNS